MATAVGFAPTEWRMQSPLPYCLATPQHRVADFPHRHWSQQSKLTLCETL